MSNLTKKTIAKGTAAALVISAGVATTANAEVRRVSGENRYSTSDAIVKEGWASGSQAAILASGLDANTVDALTVAPLAKAKNAPVVLVNPKDSIANIVAKFKALNTKTIYIANGTGVISTDIEAGLKAAGITTVYRLGGTTRYETALNIAKTLGTSNSIVVANGEDAHLVDSLSIAPIAAAKGMPIFLAGSSLDKATTDYINKLEVKTTYVLGGADTVDAATVSALPGVNRLEGAGRYETNAKVVDTFKADVNLNLNNIFIASGEDENLVDALAGAPLAASKGAPIVFVHDTINPAINTLLRSVVTETTKITELGGIGAVTKSAHNAINTIQVNINKPVVKVTTVSLNKATSNLIVGGTDTLIATVNPTDTTNKDVTWASSNSAVATVSNTGKVTAVSVGTATITATTVDGSKTASCNITVKNNSKGDIITFLDKNLEKEIRDTINKPTGDILKDDVNKITTLEIYGVDISNLSGIENLTSLNTFKVYNSQVSNIDPLKGLTNLTCLHLVDNQISNIDALNGLTNLNELILEFTQTSNIDGLKGLTNLTCLDLYKNQISNIDALKGLTNLTRLELSYNKISNIDALKGLTNLTFLELFKNEISNIDALKGLTKLTELHLFDNKISNIDPLKGLTNLTKLSLPKNQISNIDALKGLTNLTNLDLAQNQISNIDPLKGLINLTYLGLLDNHISNIDALKGLSNLTSLYLRQNQIKDYSPTSSYYKNLKEKDFILK